MEGSWSPEPPSPRGGGGPFSLGRGLFYFLAFFKLSITCWGLAVVVELGVENKRATRRVALVTRVSVHVAYWRTSLLTRLRGYPRSHGRSNRSGCVSAVGFAMSMEK